MKYSRILISLFLVAAFVACTKVPITGRKQVRLLPESLINEMAVSSYNQFLTTNPVMPSSNADARMVGEVGSKISRATTQFMHSNGFSKRVKGFNWEIKLVNNSQVNAWAMPGGKIVIYSGILPYTKDEAGLATVIGHEIGHVIAKHGNERMSQQLAVYLGGISLAVAMNEQPEKTRNVFLAAYGVGSVLGTLAYSRKHEYEADKLGMVFMAMAGYDPHDAITFWHRMTQNKGASMPEFLSTHPSDENRIKAMQEFLPVANTYYKK